jgi:hypothetical protein
MATYKLDILDKEKKERLPYWLDARQKQQDSGGRKAIREKHRARWLADKKAKRKK